MNLFLLEDAPDFGSELVEQYLNRVIIDISGIVWQHLTGENGERLAIMRRFSLRARLDYFTARKHPREKRFARASRSLIQR